MPSGVVIPPQRRPGWSGRPSRAGPLGPRHARSPPYGASASGLAARRRPRGRAVAAGRRPPRLAARAGPGPRPAPASFFFLSRNRNGGCLEARSIPGSVDSTAKGRICVPQSRRGWFVNVAYKPGESPLLQAVLVDGNSLWFPNPPWG